MAFGEMRRSEAEGRLPKATAKPPARARGGEAFESRLRAPKIRFSFRFHFPAQPLGDHTPTTKAPHAPLGLRSDFKGTSLGVRLDLTASRAGPAWGKGVSTFTGRGIAPLPTRRPLRGGPAFAGRGGFVFISWRGGAAGLFR